MKIYDTIIEKEPITEGWSEDKKYRVTTTDGTKYLLRISPIAQYEAKKVLFAITEQIAALNVPMCIPVEFGTCDEGVYCLQSWINGVDLKPMLPSLSEAEQYTLGLQAGIIAKKIHSIPIPDEQNNWSFKYSREIDGKIKEYRECSLHFEGDNYIFDYIELNRHLLENRPQSFLVWDFNIMNMMSEDGSVKIIDFEYYNTGDPWNEFCCIVWSAVTSPHFATGQIHSYFDGEPPAEFWKLLALYNSVLLLTLLSSSWAATTDIGRGASMGLSQSILKWFDNMQNPIPSWYLRDFYVQHIDGIPYKLKSPFDFGLIGKYGKVFKIYDDQDSGNICFGVQDCNNDKYFVKFAGAPTARANISQQEAVDRMKSTVPIYQDLAHPLLTQLINAEEVGGGYSTVFEWTDAECMGRMYPQSRAKFLQTPLSTRLQVFNDILDFHAHVANKGYVAIDFYDGCIMYDFNLNRTVICDIEFYAKSPYINNMGRMWGSSRFMSPEEFSLGATIDEITNVYTMGATAFALFGDERDRCLEKWKLSNELFYVAKQAVSDDRNTRQQSIEQFISEWRSAM